MVGVDSSVWIAASILTLTALPSRPYTKSTPMRQTPTTEYSYTVYFEPQPEGGYNVVVPAIPEICTFGATLEEARAMAADAIRCYLESALKHGERIAADVEPARERIKVAV